MSRRPPYLRRNNESEINRNFTENEKEFFPEKTVQKEEIKDETDYIVKLLLSEKSAWTITADTKYKIIWKIYVIKKFGCELRLSSKRDDFYPGTSERACLLKGNINELKSTLDYILNLNEVHDNKEQILNTKIKLLIPKPSLEVIMYRGYGLRNLCERNSVEIFISERNEEKLREVIMNINGSIENIIGVCISLAKMIRYESFTGIFRNVSYEDFNTYIRMKKQEQSNYLTKPMPRIQTNQQPWIQNRHMNYVQQQYNLMLPNQQQFHQQGPIHHNNHYNMENKQEIIEIHQQEFIEPSRKKSTNDEKNNCEEVSPSSTKGEPIPSITTFWRKD